jgi:hypothetical protein
MARLTTAYRFGCYQVLLEQPPLLPVQLRLVTPVVPSLVIVNVLPDFDVATTV